jgi:hypothetical protein
VERVVERVVDTLSATGIAQVMTDDGAYVRVPGIHVFMANCTTAIAQAHAQCTVCAGHLACEVDWMVKTCAAKQRSGPNAR